MFFGYFGYFTAAAILQTAIKTTRKKADSSKIKPQLLPGHRNYKVIMDISAVGEKTESQDNTPESAVAISGMEIEVMVLRFLTGIKTKFSLQKKPSQKKRRKSSQQRSRLYKK